jgi:hypothetical protein
MAKKTTPKRTYIAFRYEENTLKHYLKGQLRSRNINAKISDFSLKEKAPTRNWKRKAEDKMKRASQVVVIAGPTAHNSRGVKAEVKIARKLNKPICQIRGTTKKSCPRVPGAGRYYRWNYTNLEKIFGKGKR